MVLNQLQKEMLETTPFVEFLGLEVVTSDEGIAYQLPFREEHIGNTLLRTFHGGILASFGEITAALYLVQSLELEKVPSCSSMTFDYLRPAFAGNIRAEPRLVRAGRRFIVVSVDIYLEKKLVSIGRIIYTR
ncbi:hypothetical protein OLMES_1282 [Oleiphilus messinensis]|uniref:Thioesterase domain-containing protein n=1 Tax=Oleiphilus messinensis TaxID=141451 RepID=A0A1Y0I4M4_9GAMM|nr:PaaI family thioesterase [Oleiphilus messinensis]ARU55361.1 hypothetical protein OLMES_1282 [Oleiphilus messinensis]